MAPSIRARGPVNRVPRRQSTVPMDAFRAMARVKTWFAPSKSLRPMRIAVMVRAPMVVSIVRAEKNMMKGKEMLIAPTAFIPTPWPTKMPSTIPKRKILTMLSIEGTV